MRFQALQIPKGGGYLIPTVMAESLAVLFQREMMSSLLLIEITAPQISFPTMNCSPMMAKSYWISVTV